MGAVLFGGLPRRRDAAAALEMPFEGGAAPAERSSDGGYAFAFDLFPELREWRPVLERLAVAPGDAAYAALAARENGTELKSELVSAGLVDEARFVQALAEEVGVAHVKAVDPERLIIPDEAAVSCLRRRSWYVPVKLAERDGATSFLIAPDRLGLARLRDLVARYPAVIGRLKVAAPGALRDALLSRVRLLLAKRATSDLFDRFPDLSARLVANAWQGAVIGGLLVGLAGAIILQPAATWLLLHFVFTLFFLSCVGLRVAALVTATPPAAATCPAPASAGLPVYSVLVALHREAEVVPELVAALERLEWPPSKLEIKLVCEADDRATLDAIRSLALPRHMSVVAVPVFGPRTKPKALAYALPLVTGEFVVLYDAEDHPHPRQLVAAWRKFEASPRDVACVQAALEASNGDAGLVARLFAFEYAAQFRGLLPWLASRRLLLPLGGTSNHFRGVR